MTDRWTATAKQTEQVQRIRNLAINTCRLAGRANIAHARRDLHDRTDTFAVYSI